MEAERVFVVGDRLFIGTCPVSVEILLLSMSYPTYVCVVFDVDPFLFCTSEVILLIVMASINKVRPST